MTNQYTTKYISHARSHKATPGAMTIATLPNVEQDSTGTFASGESRERKGIHSYCINTKADSQFAHKSTGRNGVRQAEKEHSGLRGDHSTQS